MLPRKSAGENEVLVAEMIALFSLFTSDAIA
jgi:hypothetical protein